MTFVTSISFDNESWNVIKDIPPKQRSKFVRNCVKLNDEFLTEPKLIVNALNNKSLRIDEFTEYVRRLTNVLEAQLEK